MFLCFTLNSVLEIARQYNFVQFEFIESCYHLPSPPPEERPFPPSLFWGIAEWSFHIPHPSLQIKRQEVCRSVQMTTSLHACFIMTEYRQFQVRDHIGMIWLKLSSQFKYRYFPHQYMLWYVKCMQTYAVWSNIYRYNNMKRYYTIYTIY